MMLRAYIALREKDRRPGGISWEQWWATIEGEKIHPYYDEGVWAFLWKDFPDGAWLVWQDGVIEVLHQQTDPELLDLLVRLARKLGAEVRGNEGELLAPARQKSTGSARSRAGPARR